jgi:GAF domain-containing protein
MDSEVRERGAADVTAPAMPGATEPAEPLGTVMGRVARVLQREHGDVVAMLLAITRAAARSVPGTEECGISYLVGRRTVEPRAATGDLPRQMDQAQNRLGEGPCLDAVRLQTTVRCDDFSAERRWPRFTAAASRLGVGSSLSFHLFVDTDALGALNLYARRTHAFTDESEAVGLVFASHASVALQGARQQQSLRSAMDHRDLVGQAKGILMERYKLTAEQAFAALVHASSITNRKLTDIAEELTTTGAMPSR